MTLQTITSAKETESSISLLKRWRVDETGHSLDVSISPVTFKDLHLEEQPYIGLRIGIKQDAPHQGGVNLFGDNFGDHNQTIIMRLDCVEKQ